MTLHYQSVPAGRAGKTPERVANPGFTDIRRFLVPCRQFFVGTSQHWAPQMRHSPTQPQAWAPKSRHRPRLCSSLFGNTFKSLQVLTVNIPDLGWRPLRLLFCTHRFIQFLALFYPPLPWPAPKTVFLRPQGSPKKLRETGGRVLRRFRPGLEIHGIFTTLSRTRS